MKNQFFTALAESLATAPAADAKQPNMRNYLPENLTAGTRFNLWTGVIYDWAPVRAGGGVITEISDTHFRIRGSAEFVGRKEDFDLEMRILSPDTARITIFSHGSSFNTRIKAEPVTLFYVFDVQPGQEMTVQQKRYGRDARFWIKGVPTIGNVAAHLQFI